MPVIDESTAESVLDTYRVDGNVYLLGSLSSGVTVYKQQVRAHNLAVALATSPPANFERVAVIGGGIAGLTVTAGLMTLLPQLEIKVFEKRWDLCPIQQGAETRWLHPHIYDWPVEGSRAPSADLPLLNWREGTAAEVVDEVLRRFADVCEWRPRVGGRAVWQRLNIFVGVSYLSIDPKSRSVEWVGREAELVDGFVTASAHASATTEAFDAVIIASGFGVEISAGGSRTPSYWRNDSISQPVLVGEREVFVVSGYGDGAIIDLCRLTVERFRQGSILEELLGMDVDNVGDDLAQDPLMKQPFKDAVQNSILMQEMISTIVARLQTRLRKDVLVMLHGAGKDGKNRTIWDLLAGRSSFLNKVLLYSLFKVGAFTLTFEPLPVVIRQYGVRRSNQIRRHGTRAKKEVLSLFAEGDVVSSRLDDMAKLDEQSAGRLWPPGSFPYIARSR